MPKSPCEVSPVVEEPSVKRQRSYSIRAVREDEVVDDDTPLDCAELAFLKSFDFDEEQDGNKPFDFEKEEEDCEHGQQNIFAFSDDAIADLTTLTNKEGKTLVVPIDGKALETTANDLCALANQACGYNDCVPAVLLLHNKPMAGDSTFADYMDVAMDATTSVSSSTDAPWRPGHAVKNPFFLSRSRFC